MTQQLSDRNIKNREWCAKNPEKRKAQRKRYYLKHREKILKKDREKWTLIKQDPVKRMEYNEYWRNYTRNNYEARLLSNIKSRCKKFNIPFDLTLDDIKIPEVCPKTGVKLVTHKERGKFYDTPSLDRINPSLGYIKGNVRIVCLWYNVAKLVFTDEDVLRLCKQVVAISSNMDHVNSADQGITCLGGQTGTGTATDVADIIQPNLPLNS